MTYELIDSAKALDRAAEILEGQERIALDCEAAGFHRYSDRLCLVQLSTPENTIILDPLAVELSSFLKPILEDPETQVIMHGADYDVRLLDRDLDIRLHGLFDTQAAASLLGAPAVGLAALLEDHLGVKLSKKHQRADWAQRPLPDEMLEYAAHDTSHLMGLADILQGMLVGKGREEWAKEEFAILEAIRWEEEDTDPVTRVKGARDLTAREVTALREALEWRNKLAQAWDRAPFRVAGDQILLSVILERPSSPHELGDLKGMSPRLAKQHGKDLLARLRKVETAADDELKPYPRWKGNGHGRPTQEEDAVANRIRDLRTKKANGLELDRGVLLSNAQIAEIVRNSPTSLEELTTIRGIRKWQAEILGEEVVEMVKDL